MSGAFPDRVCRWGGCNVLVGSIGGDGWCPEHRRTYHNKRDGATTSDGHAVGVGCTADERQEIRHRMARLEDPKKIARDLGITKKAVLDVMNRRSA